MKIKLKREGGFAGQIIEREIDLQDLSGNVREAIESIINSKPKKSAKSNPFMRDGFVYTLEWKDSKIGKKRFDDLSIPDEIKKLLD
ncbi:MAG: hypothetical protein KF775_09210 [Cyclobacteriaceae bacterium]|nr:hypothetical protein [Cyclobacteriaceae bacterium]